MNKKNKNQLKLDPKLRKNWEFFLKKLAETEEDVIFAMPESEWDQQEWQWN